LNDGINDLHEFYNLNQDLSSLVCDDDRLGNIYETIVMFENSHKYNILYKVKDNGNIREFSFRGNGMDEDPSKFSLIFCVNNSGFFEQYLTYYLHEYEYVEDKYILFDTIYIEKDYNNSTEF